MSYKQKKDNVLRYLKKDPGLGSKDETLDTHCCVPKVIKQLK